MTVVYQKENGTRQRQDQILIAVIVQIDEQGGEVACAPYACGPSGCYTQCDSIQQCAPPNVCRGDGTCGGSKASGDDGGCSVEPAPSDSSPLLLVGLLLLRRRRRVCAR